MISRVDSNSIEEILIRWKTNRVVSSKFGGYTDYLAIHARGERQTAIHKHLRPFVESMKASEFDTRYEFVHAACCLVDFEGRHARSSPVPGMPHDLLEKVAIPTLVEATERNENDAYAWLWLAMLPSNQHFPTRADSRALLERAHRLAPLDQNIAARFADALLHGVWFACHHLPDALLASREVVSADIAALRDLAKRCSATKAIVLAEALGRYETMLSEFKEPELRT
jgi:hypothetical protein